MDPVLIAKVVLQGLVEGLTEFLPISSTGHLILLGEAIGFTGPFARTFQIAIQLGAILAVCTIYFGRLWRVLIGLPRDRGAQRFAVAVLLGFLPAALLGALLHSFIKEHLFTPAVVASALIGGGIAILLIEPRLGRARVRAVEEMPAGLALRIGMAQCLALIPGMSRSGATIIGALVFGADRKTAAEYSFFLAIPTMIGAVAYDMLKSREHLTAEGLELIAIGFVVAFLSATLVVRWLVRFVSRHGFAPFAWYRIALGLLVFGLLAIR